jgi:hypothetical protein
VLFGLKIKLILSLNYKYSKITKMVRSNGGLDIKIHAFCQVFGEFLGELSKMYPTDTSLRLLKNACALIAMASERSLVVQVMDCISPYSQRILDRDESFFRTEFKEEFDNSSYIVQEFNKIHDIWMDPETTDNTKECIWNYFTVFVKLGTDIITKIDAETKN